MIQILSNILKNLALFLKIDYSHKQQNIAKKIVEKQFKKDRD